MAFEVAIIGNPNVGKTSLFNIITGTRQYVANWPGVTVEKKVGSFKYKGHDFKLVDLPGIYTLSAMSDDERVARDYFLNESPDAIIVVCDALNLERSMILAFQILQMNIPVVMAINSIDEAEEKGKTINPEIISKSLNIPVILTSAKKISGIAQLLDSVHKTAESKTKFSFEMDYDKDTRNFINYFINEAEKYTEFKSYDSQWLALYLLDFGFKSFFYPETIKKDIESNYNLNKLKDNFLNLKLKTINELANSAVTAKGRDWSTRDILDHVLTHKFFGLIIYILALFLVFSLTFNIAAPISDLLEMLFAKLGEFVGSFIKTDWLRSLIVDGIISGVGGVIVFIPQIFVLFFFMGFLEESGYLPRAAFLVDKLVRRFGLSGRSFMSIILGFGCNVPAIMSTRTVSNPKERLALILSIPFSSCSARLPVYIILIGAFFSKQAALVMLMIYMTSIFLVLISAKILQLFVTKGNEIPFTIELPRFRMPTIKNLMYYTWEKGKHFLAKAASIILISAIAVWFLSYFPVEKPDDGKYAAMIGHSMEILTKHLGWDWKTNTALLFGVAAKEVIVSTYSTFLNSGEDSITFALSKLMSPRSAIALIFFILAYVPCFATLATVQAETGSIKWASFTFIYTTVVAYILANLAYLVAGVFL